MSEPEWKLEFPSFTDEEIPQLPESWEDISWRNETCPSFYHPPTRIKLWVERALFEDREDLIYSRYELVRMNETCEHSVEDLLQSENWEEVKGYLKAKGAW